MSLGISSILNGYGIAGSGDEAIGSTPMTEGSMKKEMEHGDEGALPMAANKSKT